MSIFWMVCEGQGCLSVLGQVLELDKKTQISPFRFQVNNIQVKIFHILSDLVNLGLIPSNIKPSPRTRKKEKKKIEERKNRGKR